MKNKNFGAKNWKEYIPMPVYKQHPEYQEFYLKAWELAFEHVKNIPGMVQNPYMDEAFCATQIWIWDTCFMSLFCKYAPEVFPGVETFDNFYGPLYENKGLATIMPPENEPDWTDAVHTEPYEIRVHIYDNPPLFAWAEYENLLMSGDIDRVRELLYERKVLQKHYEWIENLHESVRPEHVHCPTCLIAEPLGYKWEGGRSGMDNTPRGRKGEHAYEARPNNPDMLWIDAICQQALSAEMIARMYKLLDDTENAQIWMEKYEAKKKIVNEYYWDDKDNFYYDIDCNTHEFYKVMTIASYWTMTAHIASDEQAKLIVKQLSNPETLGGFVPLVSLARNDNDYKPTGRYWRGSVWMPTAYAALKGLNEYGMYEDSREAASKLLEHMYRTYKEFSPHTIWECYSPEEYKPGSTVEHEEFFARKDFCGWSALGPISMYIECVLGFHSIDALNKTVKWNKATGIEGEVGIKNLHFGDIVTDIVADGSKCSVISNAEYTLEINGKQYSVVKGENTFDVD